MTDLKYYVYALIDPRDGKAFYIGKGSGLRMKAHVWNAISGQERNGRKGIRILGILGCGLKVVEKKLRLFKDEALAYAYERRLIKRLRVNLTNMNAGKTYRSREQRDSFLAATALRIFPPFKSWQVASPDQTLEEQVTSYWGMQDKFLAIVQAGE